LALLSSSLALIYLLAIKFKIILVRRFFLRGAAGWLLRISILYSFKGQLTNISIDKKKLFANKSTTELLLKPI
jgi:hypothetical protein